MRVEVTLTGDWSYGLIQRNHHGHGEALAEIQAAYYALIIELRGGHPSIWHMPSHLDPDAYSLDYPPLTAHFRRIGDEKLSVFAFEEQE